jgi:hypothetical protein
VAAAVRDEIERQLGSSLLPIFDLPTFAECAETTMARMSHLARCSQDDRRALLRAATTEKEAGSLRAYFGAMRIDEIRTPILLDWWHSEIIGRGLKTKTGRAYLDTISAVLGDAVDIELLESNPVDHFRAVLRRRNRTQKGRSRTGRIATLEKTGATNRARFASEGAIRGASILGPPRVVEKEPWRCRGGSVQRSWPTTWSRGDPRKERSHRSTPPTIETGTSACCGR